MLSTKQMRERRELKEKLLFLLGYVAGMSLWIVGLTTIEVVIASLIVKHIFSL